MDKSGSLEPDGDVMALRVMIALLRSGREIDHASTILFLAALWWAPAAAHDVGKVLLCAAMLLAVAEKYFAWRVALDAALFDLLACAPERGAPFDAALAMCVGGRNGSPARTLASRWSGARRLLFRQGAAVGLQAGCLIAAPMLS